MKSLWLILFGSLLAASASPPPGYYDSALGKTGSDLRHSLHEIIKGHTVLAYSRGTNSTSDALKVLDQERE